MDRYNPIPVKINSDALFQKFLEDNRKKIPKDVIVERVESSHHVLQEKYCGEGVAIHAFALSLGLYLPLNPLISEILSNLGLAPTQLGPNCWRVMFSILALNQYFCKIKLGWKEFCYCYIVKKNSAGFYYFSPREKQHALVTNLPKSEKGWQDVYINIKGNWGGARTENTSCEPAGANYTRLKPRDWEVNFKDLRKAWSFENKDWRYLLDPANWRNDGAAGAGSSLLTEAWDEVQFIGGISSLENIDNEVVEQPWGESLVDEMTTNVSLSFQNQPQPPSKKQKTIHYSGSGSGGVAHDDHHIMNLESTPATRVCGGQEAAGDLSHHILPNHSHFQSSNNPPQLHHSTTSGAGMKLFKETMNTLRSSLFSAEYKSDGEFDHFEKAIGKMSVDDENGLGLARLLVMVLTSFVDSQDSKNKTIRESKATIERLEKELADSKLAKCKEPIGTGMEHGESSTAAQFESLRKDVEVMRSDLATKTKDIEGLRSELTKLKEMRPRGQINEHPIWFVEPDITTSDYLLSSPCPQEDFVGYQRSENLNGGPVCRGTQPTDDDLELSLSNSKN